MNMSFCLFCGDALVSGYNDSRVNGTGMEICLKCRKEKLGITTNKQMADFMLSSNPNLNKDEIYKKMNIREAPKTPTNIITKYDGGKVRKSPLDKELFSMNKLANECIFGTKKSNMKKGKYKK